MDSPIVAEPSLSRVRPHGKLLILHAMIRYIGGPIAGDVGWLFIAAGETNKKSSPSGQFAVGLSCGTSARAN